MRGGVWAYLGIGAAFSAGMSGIDDAYFLRRGFFLVVVEMSMMMTTMSMAVAIIAIPISDSPFCG